MGNKQNFESDQLEYYMEVQEPQHGLCEVYSSNKFSNCFIIKIEKSFDSFGQLSLFGKVEDQQNIYLQGLYGYRMGKNCDCNVRQPFTQSVVSFWQYLSFSLRDIIIQRKKLGMRFQESELWHILKACTYGFSALQRNNVAYDFKPSKMMVNRDGRIRLNWMHLESKNTHTHFYKKVLSGSLVLEPEQFLSPEQLEAVLLKQLTPKINTEKSNIFSLGMTLLECISLLEPSKAFYFNLQVRYDRINEVMGSPHCKIYSQFVLYLVGSMLRQDWRSRPSFSEINQKFESHMKRDYAILTVKSNSTILEAKKMSIKEKLSPNYY